MLVLLHYNIIRLSSQWKQAGSETGYISPSQQSTSVKFWRKRGLDCHNSFDQPYSRCRHGKQKAYDIWSPFAVSSEGPTRVIEVYVWSLSLSCCVWNVLNIKAAVLMHWLWCWMLNENKRNCCLSATYNAANSQGGMRQSREVYLARQSCHLTSGHLPLKKNSYIPVLFYIKLCLSDILWL